MYNSNIQTQHELPSSRQLMTSTLIAFLLAFSLLISCILPAEYGIDPTGIGRTLGLTQMGEIKVQLAQEAAQEQIQQQASNTTVAVVEPPQATEQARPTDDVVEPPVAEPAVESYQVTLAPGEAAEVKLAMTENARVDYFWFVNQGHVNFDTHADNPQVKYHNYNKGKAVKRDRGVMTAVFDGKHGWFWRNRSDKTVKVTLQISGDYSSLIRVI